jgi:hypothetical protein
MEMSFRRYGDRPFTALYGDTAVSRAKIWSGGLKQREFAVDNKKVKDKKYILKSNPFLISS